MTLKLNDLFLDCIECCVHQVIFLRDVYPDRIFTKAKKFGVPVMQCKHPFVNKYITDHLQSIREKMDRKALIEKIEIGIFNHVMRKVLIKIT